MELEANGSSDLKCSPVPFRDLVYCSKYRSSNEEYDDSRYGSQSA